MKFIGLDLAWSARNPSGAAVLEESGDGAVLTSSGVLGDDAEVLAFLDAHTSGPCLVAVDAPLSVPNLTGQRPAEAQLAAVFGKYQAGAHPANRTLLGRYNGGVLRGEWLRDALAERGIWDEPADVADTQARVCLEVYPHAAMVALFGLERTLKYKRKKQGREVMLDAWDEYHRHLSALTGAKPPLTGLDALLAVSPGGLKGAALKNHEDEGDAVMCAYIALYAHRFPARCEVFGSVAEGYILTPTLPERWKLT
ncbi:DUF429 domain-containing protein [Deinococcus psychrotolerans]|uniref:DUF429 domain-containing protein n=1 Tax=Deinococcus psychrotolerans TaxID=2489213 RepID=A0A3G8Y874_9DEIO|nr:DUF429 domain-containing protein [Deinococcus psychrotolerans]AZI41568.1 DUF429 domain-containing protein [Deinococcus psychrotolerans]